MRGRMPSEGRFVGTGSAHAALTIGSRALGASEPRQVRKEAALRTPSQVPRLRPIRASDAGTSGDADLEAGARSRASPARGLTCLNPQLIESLGDRALPDVPPAELR